MLCESEQCDAHTAPAQGSSPSSRSCSSSGSLESYRVLGHTARRLSVCFWLDTRHDCELPLSFSAEERRLLITCERGGEDMITHESQLPRAPCAPRPPTRRTRAVSSFFRRRYHLYVFVVVVVGPRRTTFAFCVRTEIEVRGASGE